MKPTIEYRAKGPLTKRQVAQKIAEGSAGAITRGLPGGAKPVGKSKVVEEVAEVTPAALASLEKFEGASPPEFVHTAGGKPDRREYLKLAARERRKRETAAAKGLGITVAEYRVRKSKGEFQ